MGLKQPQRILLLSQHFPFGPGEQFLWYEIQVFSQLFETVELLPTDCMKTNPLERFSFPLPRNVIIRTDGMELLKRLKHKSLADLQTLDIYAWFYRAWFAWQSHPLAQTANFRAQLSYSLFMARFLHCARRIHRCLEQMGSIPENIFSYWLNAATFGAALWSKRNNVNMIARAHGADLYPHRLPMKWQPLQAQTLQLLQGVFCVSQHGQKHLQTYHPSLAGKIHLLRLGVPEQSGYCPCSQDGQFRIITIGNVIAVKRLERLMFALMYCNMPVIWTHVGDGDQMDWMKHLSQFLPPHVKMRWLGSLSSQTLQKVLRLGPWDLFVNTSDSEGFPVSIMESLAVGLPVLAAPVDGLTDIFPLHLKDCLPCNYSYQELAVCLRRFYQKSSEERWQLQLQAKNIWQQFFNQTEQNRLLHESLSHLFA